VTVREEFRLRVFENRVLRRKYGPKTRRGTKEWRNLQNELHTSTNKSVNNIEKKLIGGACSTYEERSIQGFCGQTGVKETTGETQ
jgi:hypothetical protein